MTKKSKAAGIKTLPQARRLRFGFRYFVLSITQNSIKSS